MDTINSIRDEYYRKGKTISEIERQTGYDRKTIRKYINMDDFNQAPVEPKPTGGACPPKLEPFRDTIDRWLTDDLEAKKKQRHTATRVFERLSKESATKDSFDCSYRTVAAYVSAKKKDIYSKSTSAALPLEHKCGEAQLDFGNAQFYENGKIHDGKYLNIVFPQSNQGFLQLFYGENAECLYEGMIRIFNFIGGVPSKIWFDNMSTVVKEVLKGGDRRLTDGFLKFMNHYGFDAAFCNPNAGNEKGCVENKVGYNRRNMLVPIPKFNDIDEFNEELLSKCIEDGDRDHYRENALISELFEGDKKKLLPMPLTPLDVAGYAHLKTDKYGRFYLNEKKHAYSTAPKYARCHVNIRLTSKHVIVLDESYREVTRHKRIYGDMKDSRMNWLPYLTQISKRPRALKYTGIYDMMPENLKNLLDSLDNGQVGGILKMIAALTEKTDFETTMKTVDSALSHGAVDADSILSLHSMLNDDLPEMPQLTNTAVKINQPKVVVADLSAYAIPIQVDGGDRRGN